MIKYKSQYKHYKFTHYYKTVDIDVNKYINIIPHNIILYVQNIDDINKKY